MVLLVVAVFLGAVLLGAALLALDTLALLLDALVVVLVFLLLEGADLRVVVLLDDLVLELLRLDLFCLLLDRRPRRPPLLAIVFLVNTFVVPLNDRALTG